MMKFSIPGGKRDLIKKAGSSMFISVAGAAVILAFALVSINFMWGQLKYNNQVNGAKEEVRDTIKANIEEANSLKTSFVALNQADDLIPGQGDKSNSEIVLDALPRKYDFPALRTSIEKLAAISGVKITGFGGEDQESQAVSSMTTPSPIEILFNLTVSGDYDSIKRFIRNTENTIRPIKIDRLTLGGRDDEMSATLSMTTYYQPSIDLTVQKRVLE